MLHHNDRPNTARKRLFPFASKINIVLSSFLLHVCGKFCVLGWFGFVLKIKYPHHRIHHPLLTLSLSSCLTKLCRHWRKEKRKINRLEREMDHVTFSVLLSSHLFPVAGQILFQTATESHTISPIKTFQSSSKTTNETIPTRIQEKDMKY